MSVVCIVFLVLAHFRQSILPMTCLMDSMDGPTKSGVRTNGPALKAGGALTIPQGYRVQNTRLKAHLNNILIFFQRTKIRETEKQKSAR